MPKVNWIIKELKSLTKFLIQFWIAIKTKARSFFLSGFFCPQDFQSFYASALHSITQQDEKQKKSHLNMKLWVGDKVF